MNMTDENVRINNTDTPDNDTALLVKYLQERTSPEETRRVEAWIDESETNRKEAGQIAELFFTKRAYDRMASRNVDTAYQKVLNRIRHKTNKKSVFFERKTWLYVAASFIGALLLSSAYIYLRGETGISVKTNYLTAESNPGVRSSIRLSDGTVVYLNSGSKLTYPDRFNGNRRDVELTGEACFQVKSDRTKPFFVHINDDKATVQALGTTFNVQSFDNDNEFSATLVEGSVIVTVKHTNGSTAQMKLAPSEKAVFDKKTDSLRMVKADTEQETGWIRDRLIFRNQPLPQVLKTLAYNYNVEFEIKNPAIFAYRFTGTFQSRQLTQVLEYIKISSNVNYTISFPHSDDSSETGKTKVVLK